MLRNGSTLAPTLGHNQTLEGLRAWALGKYGGMKPETLPSVGLYWLRLARGVGGVGGVAAVSGYCGKYVDYNLSVRIRLHFVANLCELRVSVSQTNKFNGGC